VTGAVNPTTMGFGVPSSDTKDAEAPARLSPDRRAHHGDVEVQSDDATVFLVKVPRSAAEVVKL